MRPIHSSFIVLAGLGASFLGLYGGVVAELVQDWATDDNYSHGFLIVPVAAALAWSRRDRLRAAPLRPSSLGFAVVIAGVAMAIGGVLGADQFLQRAGMLGTLGGTLLYVFGWQHVRILAFPLGLLLLAVPIPPIIFNQVAFPLQLIASEFGAHTLAALNVPVLREGTVIVLASTSLEVAEACSGIRSLVSLLALGILYGYFLEPRAGVRVALAVATVPLAIVANGARVAGTGVLAHYYGVETALGFFHMFSGWIVFGVAVALMMAVHRVVRWVVPGRWGMGAVPRVAEGS